MLKSKYGINLAEDERPFYFAYNAEKTHPILFDNGVIVMEFVDGAWVETEPKVLRPNEWKDITKEEFLKHTNGVMPDVDPKDLIEL